MFSRGVDVVLTGGVVYDGTGAPPRTIDIGVRRGRLVLGPLPTAGGGVIDVSGLVVAPGFVDIHTHSDLTLLADPTADSAIRQGVTTQVVGNCGLGVAPVAPAGTGAATAAEIRSAASYLDLDPELELGWTDIAGYLAAVERAGPACNVATFVPHGPVRASVVGFDGRPSSPAERDRILGLVADGLDDGAVGLSTGLVYPPVNAADDDELVALAEVVAGRDQLFAWHVRDYADGLVPSIRQAISVARRTGCRVQISHLAAVGRRNWGRVGTVLDEIDRANDDGCDIGVDCYPYLAGSAPMSQLLPAWVHDGGEDVMRSRLSRPDLRRAIDDAWAGAHFDWADIVLTALPAAADAADRASVGRTVVQIAEDRDRRAADAAMDLLGDYGHGVLMVAFGRDERDLRTVLGHPRSMVASDGLAIDPAGVTGSAGLPHPRSFGCFPRFLSEYCADLVDGIRRCTAAPADRVGLVDRGRIADGVPADLVVFDPATLADAATYQAPQRFPAGIALVMVNGQVVVEDGHRMSARPGSTLRAGGAATRRSTDKPEVLPPGGRC